MNTQFKKGQKPWNFGKGQKFYCKTCSNEFVKSNGSRRVYCSAECKLNGYWGKVNKGLNLGKKHTEATRKIMSLKANRMFGEKNPQWKGDEVKYMGLHGWIYRKLGKASKCIICNKNKKKYYWANVSGKYLRNTNDFMELCASCHVRYDRGLIERGNYGRI